MQAKQTQFVSLVEQLHQFILPIKTESLSIEQVKELEVILNKIVPIAHAINQPAIWLVIEKIQALIAHQSQPVKQNCINTLKSQVDVLRQMIQIHLKADITFTTSDNIDRLQHILVGIADKNLSEEIINQVRYFNYTCTVFNSLAEIHLLLKQHPPHTFQAILLDTTFCENHSEENIKDISEQVPIIFLSSDDSVKNRLFAVKSGGSAYLLYPIEFTQLIEKIDQITLHRRENMPYRILIVEDSRTQAKFIQKYLEEAGMITEIVLNPYEINTILQAFQPELILMDLYMPECSGFELTKMIRQQDPYTSIPIVYLSSEDNLDKQLYAITMGGDDFLTKPIDPAHLVLSLSARAQRARALRAEMIQDGLTGLLNHTRILEQLDLEIARAKRNALPLAFAMIDIDFFKKINDNHGHPVGDKVIKSVARLLKQRLRKTDSIGRYGGEEFAIILPQTTATMIYPLMEEIRIGFSKLLHQSRDPLVEFTVTLSGGLADFSSKNHSVSHLIQAADNALYLAKERGRNKFIKDE